MFSKKGGTSINSLTTFNTYVTVVTDYLLCYAKSGKDYNICFQSVILSLIERIKTMSLYQEVEGHWGGLLTCCVEEVFEDNFELSLKPLYQGVELGKTVKTIVVQNRRVGEANINNAETMIRNLHVVSREEMQPLGANPRIRPNTPSFSNTKPTL